MAFDTTPLGELLGKRGYIRGPFGSALKRGELLESGIPVYEQQHAIEGIRTFRYFIDNQKYIKLQRFTVKVHDLIISCSGTVGRISVIQSDDPKGIISQALLILRPDIDRVRPYYLYYFLTSTAGAQELVNASQGAVQLNIAPRNVVEKIPVPLPAIEVQDKIIQQLKVIDDKIKLNRQINQNLEQIAQGIFKSWFADFEPVKAKIEAKAAGQDPERAAMRTISGKAEAELDHLTTEQYQQLAATAALFPEELVESELGSIPKSWIPQRLENMMELSYGKALTKTERKDGAYPVYGSGGITGYHDKPLVSGPGIIVGRKGTVGALYWEERDFFAIDTVFYVQPKNGATIEVLFYLLQTLGLEKMNTDAAVPGLNRNNVYRLPVPKYPKELIEAFTVNVGVVRDKIFTGLCETESLTTLRDTLLPKFLTGEIEIR